MNSQQMGLRVASLVFALVAIFHIIRLFRHTAVTVGSHVVPMGLSWAAIVLGVVLCLWMWRLSSATR